MSNQQIETLPDGNGILVRDASGKPRCIVRPGDNGPGVLLFTGNGDPAGAVQFPIGEDRAVVTLYNPAGEVVAGVSIPDGQPPIAVRFQDNEPVAVGELLPDPQPAVTLAPSTN